MVPNMYIDETQELMCASLAVQFRLRVLCAVRITCRAPSFKCNVVLKTNDFIRPLEVWNGRCCIIRSVFWSNMFLQAETE